MFFKVTLDFAGDKVVLESVHPAPLSKLIDAYLEAQANQMAYRSGNNMQREPVRWTAPVSAHEDRVFDLLWLEGFTVEPVRNE